MSEPDVFVIICRSHKAAEKTVALLQAAHFNVRKLSVIGKDYFDFEPNPSPAVPQGRKPLTERMAFWGRMWALLRGDAFFTIQGIGSIIVAGPIAGTMREAGTNPRLFHACSPLRTCMLDSGVSSRNLVKYEAALRSDRFLLIVQGDPSEIRAAAEILKSSGTHQVRNPERDSARP